MCKWVSALVGMLHLFFLHKEKRRSLNTAECQIAVYKWTYPIFMTKLYYLVWRPNIIIFLKALIEKDFLLSLSIIKALPCASWVGVRGKMWGKMDAIWSYWVLPSHQTTISVSTKDVSTLVNVFLSRYNFHVHSGTCVSPIYLLKVNNSLLKHVWERWSGVDAVTVESQSKHILLGTSISRLLFILATVSN